VIHRICFSTSVYQSSRLSLWPRVVSKEISFFCEYILFPWLLSFPLVHQFQQRTNLVQRFIQILTFSSKADKYVCPPRHAEYFMCNASAFDSLSDPGTCEKSLMDCSFCSWTSHLDKFWLGQLKMTRNSTINKDNVFIGKQGLISHACFIGQGSFYLFRMICWLMMLSLIWEPSSLLP